MKTLCAALLAMTCSGAALAQAPVVPKSRLLEGIVVDPHRARIISATVIAINEKTKHSESVHPNADGVFRLELPPGSYTLRVESTCFSPFIQRAIELEDMLELRVEVLLHVLKDCVVEALGTPKR
jgi:hypothetical protein